MSLNKRSPRSEEINRVDGVEDHILDKTLPHFAKYFNIRREVWSVDGKSRIDVVLIHKTTPELIIGVEAKKADYKRGDNIGEHILQAFRYTLSDFLLDGNRQKIPVALLPPLSYNYLIMKDAVIVENGVEYFADRHDLTSEHHTVNGMLGAFGIGEVRRRNEPVANFHRTQLGIYFQNREIWQDRRGRKTDYVHMINYSRAIKKIDEVRKVYKPTWQNGR